MAKSQRRALLRRHHAVYLTTGTEDSSLWCRLLRGYLSEGFAEEALFMLTRGLPRGARRQVLPAAIKACAALSLLTLAKAFHAESVKAGLASNVRVGTTFISVYSKCGDIEDARRFFDQMPHRNAVTYNAMISGHSGGGDMASARLLFDEMTARTPVTWTVMIEGLAREGDIAAAREFFDRTPPEMRTVVTWTALVHGYTVNGQMEAAKQVFEEMPCRNFFVWSSMITGYFKLGRAEEAREVFEQIPARNLVNWNTLIVGYTQNGFFEEALRSFRRMQEEGFEPDEVTVASALSACAQAGLLDSGKEIHRLIHRAGIRLNQFVLNGLVDMYAKCGDLGRAERIFKGMARRNRACWNTMISGLASHGRSKEALELFSRMEESGEEPCAVTFLAALSACTHGGFVQEGLELFSRMKTRYGLEAGVEHYGCLIDLLGRAGKLKEAYGLIRMMPMEPNDVVWGALLGACRIHGEAELAEQVVREVESRDDARFVLLSNIYAASSRWEEAENMRRQMVDSGVQKIPGCSLVSVGAADDRLTSGTISRL